MEKTMEVSQQTANAEATETNGSETQETTETQAAMVARETHERVLREAKETKAKYQALKRQQEEQDKARLQQNSEYEKLYVAEKEAREKMQKSLLKERIKASVSEAASKAGCIDVEALMKLGNPELLMFDEENLSVSGSQEFVEQARKQYGYLFNSATKAAVNGATPGGGVQQPKKITGESVAKMKPQDKLAVWAQLMNKN
jgi:flagellar biosynthesis GTPase FlhF